MNELTNRPLLNYVAQLEPRFVGQLYESKPICLAIFRMLPPMAQQCVLLTVFDSEIDLLDQCNQSFNSNVAEACVLLRALKIFDGSDVDRDFRKHYLESLMMRHLDIVNLNVVEEMDEKVQRAASKDLYKKAVERWECILSYLAFPDSSSKSVSNTTIELFDHFGFTKTGRSNKITSLGFQFLLLGRCEQIWTYLIYYFKYVEVTMGEEHLLPMLEFFLKLSLCVSASDILDPVQNGDSEKTIPTPFIVDDGWPAILKDNFLKHLRELGLVFIRKSKDGFFFITPLLSMLVAADGQKDVVVENSREKGFLVTETNYRLYAYTNSQLHLSILSQFTELIATFPNMAVSHMTRDTVRKALQTGITAKQITQYLRANAHPKALATHGPHHCVPPTIHLWEEERERLACQNCTIYSMFDSDQEFFDLKEYASSKGILLYTDDPQRLVVVTEEGHEIIREWYHSKNRTTAD